MKTKGTWTNLGCCCCWFSLLSRARDRLIVDVQDAHSAVSFSRFFLLQIRYPGMQTESTLGILCYDLVPRDIVFECAYSKCTIKMTF